jgi:hypothetical protein
VDGIGMMAAAARTEESNQNDTGYNADDSGCRREREHAVADDLGYHEDGDKWP